MQKSRSVAEIRELIGSEADRMSDAECLEVWAAYYRFAWAWLDLVGSLSVEQFNNACRLPSAVEQR